MRRSYSPVVLHRRVMFNLTDGSAIEGILWDERGPLLVIRDAKLHESGGPVPVDGDVILERDRLRFAQVLP
jgi:hypothetical protein